MRRWIIPLGLLMLATVPSHASTFRLDDTGTVVGQPVTPMKWRQLAPSGAADHTVEGQLSVALRLNVASWVQRSAKIFMVLAPTQGEQLTATWRTQGRLLPGSLRSGERALVYDGVVRDPFMSETLQFHLTADGRLLTRMQSLQFHFEIEVMP